MNARRLAALLLCALAALLPVRAADPAAEALADIVARQHPLLAEAAAKQTPAELEDLRPRLQKIVRDYEALLANAPDFAAAHASYGLFLGHPLIGERKQAAVQLLAANRLDPDIPLVKNQLGNYLAEEGKPVEALHYYLQAITLAPRQALYHHQVGTLLVEARDTFLQSGEWTRQKLDDAMLDAFAEATDLAPDRFDYAYRHAMAYYDLAEPEWPAALELWRELQEHAETAADRQLLQLHEANILGKLGHTTQARALLRKVTEPILAVQKKKLLQQLSDDEHATTSHPAGDTAPPASDH